jgi:replicative DNA helicase
MELKMNKLKTKIEVEKRILSLLIMEPVLIAEASQLISIMDISVNHKTPFKILFDLIEPNETEIFLALRDLKEINYFELNKPSDLTGGISTLKKLANNLFVINDSIELDNKLSSILEKNKMLKNVNECYSEINSISENYFNQKSETQINSFESSLNEVYEDIQNEIADKVKPIKSNYFPSFNKLTSGIRESNLVGLGGSFKSGKTSFSTALLIDFAEQEIPVCLFSLELSKREIISKIVSYKTGIEYSHLINPKALTTTEIQELNRVKINANQLPVYIYSELMSITQIKSKIKILRTKKDVKIFFVDYIGYIQSDNQDFNSRERELTFFSNQLKRIAKELKVTIFAVAQLNRQGSKEPTAINLAESISLARDCDYLFTIAPAENLKEELRLKLTENTFVVRLDASRHSEQGKWFPIILTNKGLRETTKENEPRSNFKIYKNFYEKEEHPF